MKWYGKQCNARVRDLMASRMERAAISFKNFLRLKLSEFQKTAGTGTKKRGLAPSAAGEYPKKVLGHLRRNVQAEVDRETVQARVGTNVLYGRFLETGTEKMARRPWLEKGLTEARAKIKAVLEGRSAGF